MSFETLKLVNKPSTNSWTTSGQLQELESFCMTNFDSVVERLNLLSAMIGFLKNEPICKVKNQISFLDMIGKIKEDCKNLNLKLEGTDTIFKNKLDKQSDEILEIIYEEIDKLDKSTSLKIQEFKAVEILASRVDSLAEEVRILKEVSQAQLKTSSEQQLTLEHLMAQQKFQYRQRLALEERNQGLMETIKEQQMTIDKLRGQQSYHLPQNINHNRGFYPPFQKEAAFQNCAHFTKNKRNFKGGPL